MFPYYLKKKEGLYCKDMKWLGLEEITKNSSPSHLNQSERKFSEVRAYELKFTSRQLRNRFAGD